MKTIGISPKVIASTVTSAALGVIVAVLNGLQEHPDLIPGSPAVQGFLLVLIPALLTFLAGYQADPGKVVPE